MSKEFFIPLILSFNFLLFIHASGQNFTWVKGSSTTTVSGVYGTQGIASPVNDPGARRGCATWTDAAGNLWLFGGEGVVINNQWFSDLWKYNPTTNEWTWVKGPNLPNSPAVYGVLGVAAPANNPGARVFSMSWIDLSGNFWLFGGLVNSGQNRYSDLWRYNPTTNQWAWMSGSSAFDSPGVYGTLNMSSPSVFPGARNGASTWIDNNGKLWLFGGRGFGSTNTAGRLNDLWKFDPANNQWTWVTGSQTPGLSGVYGTLSIPAPSNTPGARDFSGAWVSSSGKLFLFGGQGYASTTAIGLLNDMWEFNPLTSLWSWVNGSNFINQFGAYGTLGVPAASVTPGARSGMACWIDAKGEYWIFGGQGFGTFASVAGLNDLFKFNPVTNQWTWMKGSNQVSQVGIYGTQGVAAPANTPGGRDGNTWWKNTTNNFLWLFGGSGLTSVPNVIQSMNDLWKYRVPCNPDSLVASQSAVVCSGSSVSIAAYNHFPSNVNWHTSPTPSASVGSGTIFSTPTLFAQTSNSVYIFYAQANSCTISPLASINITVLPLPILSISGPSSVCPLQQTTLTASGAQTYTWSNAATANTISFSTPTPLGFTINATGANNCLNTASYSLGIFNLPNITAGSAKSPICRDETVVLTAGGGDSYIWNGTTNSPTISVSPTVSTTYSVFGTDSNGCSNSSTITQFVRVCVGVKTEEDVFDALIIYPNPSHGTFKVSLPSDGDLIILNLQGAILFEQSLVFGENLVNAGLNKGAYFVKINLKNTQIHYGKIIIE
jgi:N-acetylneuraminic acid mutarotase